jgi:hypothetical protein
MAMRGKFQGLGNRVDEPTKKELGGGPTAVPFQELFDGDRLLVKLMGGIEGTENLINGMEQDPTGDAMTAGITLDQVAKIVDVHIGVCQGECMRLAAGDLNRGEGCRHTGHTRGGRHSIGDGRTVLNGRTAGARARGTQAKGHHDGR